MGEEVRARALAFGTALAIVASIAMVGSGPADAKKKVTNPLAGSYRGTTEEGGSVSFTITRRGAVVNFVAAPTTLLCSQPWIDMTMPPPPTTTIIGTVTAALPFRLTGPEPGYPKGHRFDYDGPGGNPAGTVQISGKLAVGFRGMEGYFKLYRVSSDPYTCRDDVPPVGLVSWDARKSGGKK